MASCATAEDRAIRPRLPLVEAFFATGDFNGIKQDQIWLATGTDPETGSVLETETIVFFGRSR